jgi:type VI secretion system protein ImpK
MHLLDAFTELFYFTVVNKEYDYAQFGFADMQARYKEMIARVEERVKQAGFSDKQWLHALFAFSIWADEMMLLSQWQDRHLWQQETLQRTFFHTANGGVEFYNRLHSLDQAENAVREVYTLCLSLGFRGMYFQDSAENLRREITMRHLRLILRDKNTALPEVFFPCGYYGMGDTNRGRQRRMWRLKDLLLLCAPPLVFMFFYLIFQSKLTTIAGMWFSGN